MRLRIAGRVAVSALLLVVSAWVMADVPLAAAPNLIRNGSFEDAIIDPGDNLLTLSSGNTEVTGWLVGGTVDYCGGFWDHSDGDRSLDLSGVGPGAVEQVFTTTPGVKYGVQFDMAGVTIGNSVALKRLHVEAAGQQGEFEFDATGYTRYAMGWTTKTWVFQATEAQTTLRIVSLTHGDTGPGLDNVRVGEWGPTLSWMGTTGYETDGVDPDSGTPNSTRFKFRVKLTDPGGAEPTYVRLVLRRDGADYRTRDMNPGGQSTADGRRYSYTTRLSPGNYTYRFEARNPDAKASGEPTLVRKGPFMPSRPFLSWSSGPGLDGQDGVKPNTGYANSIFRFSVVYKDHDGDLPTYVRVHLWRNGSDAGTHVMAPPGPPIDPVRGMTYKLRMPLSAGRYQYRFEAADGHGSARGPASVKTGGLLVESARPVLSWEGGTGYESDGVKPDKGPGGGTYTFKVVLTDLDQDEPDYVRLLLRKEGRGWREVDMQPRSGAPLTGRLFRCALPLPLGNWSYRFAAMDEDGAASGDPTTLQLGPIMPAPPYLAWSKEAGYEGADGVTPASGVADSTLFTFKVVYRSHDGDLPAWVRVRLWRDGVDHLTPTMAGDGTHNPVDPGITYAHSLTLPAGEYEYQFEAEDWRGEPAVGPASRKRSGPSVSAAGGSGLTSLVSAQTAAGLQVTFRLTGAATVRARVYNIAGRPVRTLCHDRECDAGNNTLVWNATSDQGLAVPNGTYLVDVVARSEDGSQARALTQARIRR